jgi:hypothetical protein
VKLTVGCLAILLGASRNSFLRGRGGRNGKVLRCEEGIPSTGSWVDVKGNEDA